MKTPPPINHSFNNIEDSLNEKLITSLKALKAKRYSDVISQSESGDTLQWVNFVQEGGGTLGISLVGYAFALEYVGIRFLKLAGTSAGAINTLFLAAIGEKDQTKTPELFDMMMDENRMNIKSFVDAKRPLVRKVVLSVSKGLGFIKNLLVSYLVLLLLVLLPLPLLSFLGTEIAIIYVCFLLAFLGISTFILILWKKFSEYDFGINPGNKFEEFLIKELERFGITTQKDLDSKAHSKFKLNKLNLQVKNLSLADNPPLPISDSKTLFLDTVTTKDEPKKDTAARLADIEFDYSFVATDIKNEQKIVFPREADLYFENPEEQSVAKYVRASMAIPIFFEPKKFPIDSTSETLKNLWKEKKGKVNVSDCGVLIDGGSLSNFPINLFHQSHIKQARVPVMGVRIVDEEPLKGKSCDEKMTFGDYIQMVINTLRSNEDNAFLAINPFYKKYSIADIETYNTKINWLNFDLTRQQKIELFKKGVEAAVSYLTAFDWEVYKTERANSLNHQP